MRNTFRKYFSVILWLVLVGWSIIGGIFGGSIGITLSASDPYGTSSNLLFTVVGAIIGIMIGLIIGLIIVITGGGMIATFLFIDENLKILGKNNNKMGSGIRATLANIDKNLQILVDKQNKD